MSFHKVIMDYRIAGLVIAVFYAVGIAGHIYPPTLPLMIRLTPWVLLLFGLLVILQVNPGPPGRAAIWIVCTYLFTFSMEALGVATGNVFGDYRYGSSLGFQLFEVPLVIGFNWTIIVLAISGEVYHVVRSPLLGALLTGGGAVLFDWVMEPAAISLVYWHWEQGVIPLQNYLAWFAIAALCSWSFHRLRIHSASRLGALYVLIQLVFFIVLRITGTQFP
ncbi:carotenoid biosynthesis protein [Marispirochaeta sp.]|uniref:carotenoid biosynthesis protein n=1 Tax=Marispirochaeta sp. TaxID=2038653 RepID=UPI0029C7A665|nr:carotenoid biosynthesis protein [Marispirochaeta sp.]